jgi:hypothetical protein
MGFKCILDRENLRLLKFIQLERHLGQFEVTVVATIGIYMLSALEAIQSYIIGHAHAVKKVWDTQY